MFRDHPDTNLYNYSCLDPQIYALRQSSTATSGGPEDALTCKVVERRVYPSVRTLRGLPP